MSRSNSHLAGLRTAVQAKSSRFSAIIRISLEYEQPLPQRIETTEPRFDFTQGPPFGSLKDGEQSRTMSLSKGAFSPFGPIFTHTFCWTLAALVAFSPNGAA